MSLWSCPSPFRDLQQRGKGGGKELCDLLVVYDRHIIILGEKSIAWPGGNLEVALARWAKRAICKAAEQVRESTPDKTQKRVLDYSAGNRGRSSTTCSCDRPTPGMERTDLNAAKMVSASIRPERLPRSMRGGARE